MLLLSVHLQSAGPYAGLEAGAGFRVTMRVAGRSPLLLPSSIISPPCLLWVLPHPACKSCHGDGGSVEASGQVPAWAAPCSCCLPYSLGMGFLPQWETIHCSRRSGVWAIDLNTNSQGLCPGTLVSFSSAEFQMSRESL